MASSAHAADISAPFGDVLGPGRGSGAETETPSVDALEPTPSVQAQRGRNHLATYAENSIGKELSQAGDEDFLVVVSDMMANISHAVAERFGSSGAETMAEQMGKALGYCYAERAEHEDVECAHLIDASVVEEVFGAKLASALEN